jgi:hypothetical protein
VICPTHGDSPEAWTCPHIQAALPGPEPVPWISVYPLVDDAEPDPDGWPELLLCGACAAERGLPQPPREITTVEQSGSLRDKLGHEVICGACLAEALDPDA